ncbi:sodium/calcium exchanger 1-like, partial [Plakobranchus ocellatus]
AVEPNTVKVEENLLEGSSSRSSEGCEIFAIPEPAEELPKVSVVKRGSLKNVWDKKHSCMFCFKNVNKMSTHLQRVHKKESPVKRVMAMAKGSYERRKAWAELLNQGDFKHNYKVLKSGSGQLIPRYRTKNKSAEDCVVCSFCKGLYGKSLLYVHYKTCSQRKGTANARGRKGEAVRQGSMLMPLPSNVSEGFFSHVVARMQKDDVTRIILNDSLIVKFGERKFCATECYTASYISTRIRELGRLLKVVRLKTDMKVSTLTQALHPENLDLIIQSVRELAEFNEENHHFRKSSLALRLGHSIKKCASVLRAEAIKIGDEELVEQAKRFDSLFSGNWFDYITEIQSTSKTVFNQQTQKKQNVEDKPKMRKKMKRQPWSEDEINAVKRHLSDCIVTGMVPKKAQAMKAVAAEPCLRSRSWHNVKDYVYNLIKKTKEK